MTTPTTPTAPTHYTICAHTQGFRRAGRVWGATPEIVAAADLSKAQLAALSADPEIVISAAEAPVELKKSKKPTKNSDTTQ